MKVLFTLNTGFVGANYKETMEYNDDSPPSDRELEEDWTDWVWNHIEGGYEREES